jgi:hypothetical protein
MPIKRRTDVKLLLCAVAACMATVGLASTGAQAAATSHKVLVIVEGARAYRQTNA